MGWRAVGDATSRKAAGRPPLPDNQRATWKAMLRLPPKDGAAVERKADAEGLDVAAWVRSVVLAALGRS